MGTCGSQRQGGWHGRCATALEQCDLARSPKGTALKQWHGPNPEPSVGQGTGDALKGQMPTKMGRSGSGGQEALLEGQADLAQRFVLDLADALLGNPDEEADLLEGFGPGLVTERMLADGEPLSDHGSFHLA